MYLVVGSTALYRVIASWRAPKDLDVFSDIPMLIGHDVYWTQDFLKYWDKDTARAATIDEMYTIKCSHLYWDLPNASWWKHANDIINLKRHDAELIPELHDILYGVWERQHGKKRVDLNMDKEDFFDDAVPRKWDHDSIHYSVAYGDAPLYEQFVKDDAEVAIDMRKVWAAPHDTQVALFREEIYATALERWVVPSNYRCSPRAAYSKALKRTITSLTKGRSAKFIVENLDTYIKQDVDYVRRHRENAHKLIAHKRKGE